MNEPTTNSTGPEQRGLLIPLAQVGQHVRLTLGRIICPPTELDEAVALRVPSPRAARADIGEVSRAA